MNNGSDTQNDRQPSRLTRVFEHATLSMIGGLPLPFPNTPDARAARDLNAISQVAALVPANAAEVMVCVQIVTTSAQGLECQRRAQHGLDNDRFLRQAVQMFRVAQGAANMLLRLQAERRVREATPEAANSAMMTEHCAFHAPQGRDAKLGHVHPAGAERGARNRFRPQPVPGCAAAVGRLKGHRLSRRLPWPAPRAIEPCQAARTA